MADFHTVIIMIILPFCSRYGYESLQIQRSNFLITSATFFPKLTPVQERCRGERIPVVSAIVHSVTLMMKKGGGGKNIYKYINQSAFLAEYTNT